MRRATDGAARHHDLVRRATNGAARHDALVRRATDGAARHHALVRLAIRWCCPAPLSGVPGHPDGAA